MTFTSSDLGALGTPSIIETVDYEAVRAARLAEFVDRARAKGIAYDVDGTEFDPAVVLIEEASFDETVLRARGNDIARDAYLYWATGASLDHKGAFYDCFRLPGETDDRYRGRIILAIQGRSTGGTEPRYRGVALGASLRVADAFVYTLGVSPVIYVAVLATDNNGVADSGLLATVASAINAPAVRMVNDTITVRSAVTTILDVVADVWLLPDAPMSILNTVENSVPAAWAAEAGLGRDLTLDWLRTKIMVPGVYKTAITTPAVDVVMQPYDALRISSLTLNFKGRAF